jgi:hypothetical protein
MWQDHAHSAKHCSLRGELVYLGDSVANDSQPLTLPTTRHDDRGRVARHVGQVGGTEQDRLLAGHCLDERSCGVRWSVK